MTDGPVADVIGNATALPSRSSGNNKKATTSGVKVNMHMGYSLSIKIDIPFSPYPKTRASPIIKYKSLAKANR